MIKVDKNIKCDKYLKMKGVLKGGGGIVWTVVHVHK
jgi:hypothetical protein